MSDDERRQPHESEASDAPRSARSAGRDDRAAILARRQHFIALALSGLASTVACDGKTDANKAEGGRGSGDSGREAPPQPCLEIAPLADDEGQTPKPDEGGTSGSEPEPEPEIPPHACLRIAPPEDDSADPGETEGGDEVGDKPRPAPRPCLKKAAPRPCLRKANPVEPEPPLEEI